MRRLGSDIVIVLRSILRTVGSQCENTQRANTRSRWMMQCHTSTPLSRSPCHCVHLFTLLLLFLLYCVCVSGKGELAHCEEKIAHCFSNRCVCVYAPTSLSDTIPTRQNWRWRDSPSSFIIRHGDGDTALFGEWAVSVGPHTATVA